MFKVGEWVCGGEQCVGRVDSIVPGGSYALIVVIRRGRNSLKPFWMDSIRYATLAEVLHAKEQACLR